MDLFLLPQMNFIFLNRFLCKNVSRKKKYVLAILHTNIQFGIEIIDMIHLQC